MPLKFYMLEKILENIFSTKIFAFVKRETQITHWNIALHHNTLQKNVVLHKHRFNYSWDEPSSFMLELIL